MTPAHDAGVPDPPPDVDPLVDIWRSGRVLHRSFDKRYEVTGFNPGPRPRGRFSFFGNPVVPVLYAGEDEETAIAETLFHDLPGAGARVVAAQYVDRRSGAFAPTRDLRLARLHSSGLIALGLEPNQLTDTHPSGYGRSVLWAGAVHRCTDLDGLVWMSRRWNTRRAVVLFGDRVTGSDLEPVPTASRNFAYPEDFEWLASLCRQLRIEIVPPW
ncbi:MAG: RES family NAD+ phosphorylase [Nocardioidaceae bacterium]